MSWGCSYSLLALEIALLGARKEHLARQLLVLGLGSGQLLIESSHIVACTTPITSIMLIETAILEIYIASCFWY
jgi:hypothetical protein